MHINAYSPKRDLTTRASKSIVRCTVHLFIPAICGSRPSENIYPQRILLGKVGLHYARRDSRDLRSGRTNANYRKQRVPRTMACKRFLCAALGSPQTQIGGGSSSTLSATFGINHHPSTEIPFVSEERAVSTSSLELHSFK